MGKLKTVLTLCFTFFTLYGFGHNDVELPAKSNQLVYDGAGMLMASERTTLEQKLRTYNDTTSNQVVIALVDHLHQDISMAAIELGHSWGVGQEAEDNGVVIMVSKADREIFIATGYGVEPYITDVYAKRIIENIIKPSFRDGNYFAGLDKATNVIIDLLSGVYEPTPHSNIEGEGIPLWVIILLVVLILLFISSLRKKGRQYEYYRRGKRVYDQDWGRGPGNWPDFNTGGGVFRVMKKLNMKYILILAAIISLSFSCNKENKKAKTVDRGENIENVEQQVDSENPVTPAVSNTRPEREDGSSSKPKDLSSGQPISSVPQVKEPTKANTPVRNTEKDDMVGINVGETHGGSINFPLTQGNYWEYNAKNYKSGELGRTWTKKQTVTKIEGPYVYINGQKEFKLQDGKIYKTFITRGGGETNGLYFFNPTNEKDQFKTLVGGDVIVEATVKKALESVTVPAGTFNNCLVFKINSETFYVEPGVGVVKKVNGKEGGQFYLIQELANYSVK